MKVVSISSTGEHVEVSGVSTSAGTPSAGQLVQLGADGKVDISILPNGIGADAVQFVASEAITAGAFVNIASDGRIRNASATSSAMKAHGYVQDNIAQGASGTVYFDDSNTKLSGLTPGADYFLSAATPGGVTTNPPTTAGQILQKLGSAVSASTIHVLIGNPVIRA